MKIDGVIIPNYNGAKFIAKTCSTIRESFLHTPIILVDDFSSDDSLTVIKAFPPDNRLLLIEREFNGGFSAAVNTGFRQAKRMGMRYVAVSNSDVHINAETSAKILEYVRNNLKEPVAVIGFVESSYQAVYHRDHIPGFFFVIDISVIDTVGYMNEEYFMYGEEQEFFRKIMRHSFLIKQSGLIIQHTGQGSQPSNESRRRAARLAIRNTLLLEINEGTRKSFFLKLVALIVIINRAKFGLARSSPSVKRIQFIGPVEGNFELVKAVIRLLPRLINKK